MKVLGLMALPWMPIYWGDYFKKTLHLSTEEHGAYLMLIGAYWERGKPFPDDDLFFARVTKMSTKKWKMVRPKIAEFFDISEGLWRHDRVENELLRSSERQQSARANGQAGGVAKSKLTTVTITNTEDLSSFVVGRKAGIKDGHTIQDSGERLNRFKRTIAEALGGNGYKIVASASDTESPLYTRSLALCQAKAKELGKGWPHQWDAA